MIADAYDGDYTKIRSSAPLISNYDLEDPFIWHDEDGFNMMVKDMDGSLCGEELAQRNQNLDYGHPFAILESIKKATSLVAFFFYYISIAGFMQ